MGTEKNIRISRIIGYRKFGIILIICGAIGLVSSFVLTLDKLHVSSDPSFSPSCNINPIVSCVSVMQSQQSEILGFPNQIVGLMAFSSIITVGVTLLYARRLPARFWRLFIPSVWIGFAVIHWMIFQSLYVLGTLCLWCTATWIAFAPLSWYSLFFGLSQKYIKVSKKQSMHNLVDWLLRYQNEIVISWYTVILIAVLVRFWYFWQTLL